MPKYTKWPLKKVNALIIRITESQRAGWIIFMSSPLFAKQSVLWEVMFLQREVEVVQLGKGSRGACTPGTLFTCHIRMLLFLQDTSRVCLNTDAAQVAVLCNDAKLLCCLYFPFGFRLMVPCRADRQNKECNLKATSKWMELMNYGFYFLLLQRV